MQGASRPGALSAVPDPARSLADGVLVDARLRARVLGLRLLTIEATVVLAPAAVAQASPEDGGRPREPSRSAGVRLDPRGTGHTLAEARQSLSEGAQLLAEACRNGR